jgi:hypothetical protein
VHRKNVSVRESRLKVSNLLLLKEQVCPRDRAKALALTTVLVRVHLNCRELNSVSNREVDITGLQEARELAEAEDLIVREADLVDLIVLHRVAQRVPADLIVLDQGLQINVKTIKKSIKKKSRIKSGRHRLNWLADPDGVRASKQNTAKLREMELMTRKVRERITN